MEVIPYQDAFKQATLDLFRSNQDKYFDDSELADFEKFLDEYAHKCHYFVVKQSNEIIACGGYAVNEKRAYLCWGMVARSKHKQNIGKTLLLFRLNHIQEQYGEIPVHMDTSQFTKDFYQKYGFQVEKIEDDGYGKGLDRVYMCCSAPYSALNDPQ